MSSNLGSVFQSKYVEFANELLLTFPELSEVINAAKALSPEDRLARFMTDIVPHTPPTRDPAVRPAALLPGVILTDALWDELSQTTHTTMQEYLTLLTVCALFESGKAGKDTIFGDGADSSTFMDEFLKTWKTKMDGMDFENMAKKMSGIFGMDSTGIPKLPEKFLKGHLARLAEEIVREFNPADFGLDDDTIKQCEENPTSAFEILMKIYQSKPHVISSVVQRIGKRLQAKFQNGQIRANEIVAEAEELMKTFSENPAFSELMESFRTMFSMDELAKAPGEVGVSARRSIIAERMKRKLEQKKAASAAAPVTNTITPSGVQAFTEEEFAAMDAERASKGNKKKGKK
jgi:hypothetical protein